MAEVEIIKSKLLDVNNLQVTVNGHEMILEGFVRSYYNKQMATENAKNQTSLRIRNKLKVTNVCRI